MSDAPEISMGVRAKAGYVLVDRVGKDGKVHQAKDHVVVSDGMYSAKELEREMTRVAESEGLSADRVRIETYDKGETPPNEVNPRHRGLGQRYTRLPDTEREIVRPEPYNRSVWGGFGEGVRPMNQSKHQESKGD